MVTYTFTNGTQSEAPEVNQNFTDVKPIIYADNTGGSVSGSTTTAETDLATVTISQNDLGNNATLVISASGYASYSSATSSFTFRLYVNGSVVKTIGPQQLDSANRGIWGISLSNMQNSIDTTGGDVIVKITGQWSSTGGGGACTGLTVIGYKYTG